jgi:hypothetical protein
VAAEYLLFNAGTYTVNITSNSNDVTFFSLNVRGSTVHSAPFLQPTRA